MALDSGTQTNALTSSLTTKKKDASAEKENLWSAILNEVQTQGSTKLPSNKSVLVLGDNATGKTTLIAKLQGVEDPKKGSGLEYAYIDVKDEYRDDMTRLSVWVLDGDPGHTNLLHYALNETNYAHTLVILTVSMTQPWGWMEQLNHWIKVLGQHIETLQLDAKEKEAARQRLATTWQSYCEVGDDLDPGSPVKRTMRNNSIDEDDLLPLTEDALITNLGLDIVVVVTKTDYMTTLEKEYDYRDEHFDFIQQWIRNFCLRHGTSLFYTSVKEDKNCDLLYKYLTHRIYGLPFRTPALVVEKDAVLIPAGWDSLKKISILYENMHGVKADNVYSDIIKAPPTRKAVSNRETEVQTEDEQAFLARQQEILKQGDQVRGESPLRSQAGGVGSNKSGPRSSSTTGQSSPKKIDPKLTPATPGGEGVLANFFNSLLHKKSGSPASGGPGGPGSPAGAARTANGTDALMTPEKLAVRTDAAAELDRLSRSVKKEIDMSQSEC
ncbi:cytoplasmic dynein 1 light intermediate chain 1 isoform X2 [Drosophila ananassae]|uniref:cytoplasmic dynein 1 light intermediate chain 1 isoform X2 n=1 Tax=Drosophila ananassae TaxID=7217 RepID=UPI0013A5E716|nr:cytoplasmic dynein 1 light intermediate chain 1 isoform X2 [Drosophila ananassae]XP_044573468.1 cytoplasmic dynein 1 light intermediate chain 1 isoform X2 [Drosophila ananassae]